MAAGRPQNYSISGKAKMQGRILEPFIEIQWAGCASSYRFAFLILRDLWTKAFCSLLPKHARCVSILAACQKIPKRGARSASPPALHRPAGGNGTPCFPKFSETCALRSHLACQKIPKRGARSASPHALHRLAGGNGPPCFLKFSETRALR